MRGVFILSLVGLLSAISLSIANHYTERPIEEALKRAKKEALAQVLPFDVSNVETINEKDTTYYEVKDTNNALQGIGIETFTDLGFSGRIDILVGVNTNCVVSNYKVLKHQETPGLGTKITDESFKSQFKEKTLDGFKWQVKKDGGDVDAITAATISSRAITDAIHKALELCKTKYSK